MQPSTNRQTSGLGSAHVAAEQSSAQKVFNTLIRQLATIDNFTEIIYEDMSPEDGYWICHSLASTGQIKRMGVLSESKQGRQSCTMFINDGPLTPLFSWPLDGLLSRGELKRLGAGVGTTFHNFRGIYGGSFKEPDFFLRPDTDEFPSVVIESGWTASLPHLRADKDLWMKGTTSAEVVILLKWSEISHCRVEGDIEVWARNQTGNSIVKEMLIFPEPISAVDDRVEITKAQLFKSSLLADQNRDTILSLSISSLREITKEVLTKRMGLHPA